MASESEQDFRESPDQAAAWAKEAGYEESEVNDIVKSYRKAKKAYGSFRVTALRRGHLFFCKIIEKDRLECYIIKLVTANMNAYPTG